MALACAELGNECYSVTFKRGDEQRCHSKMTCPCKDDEKYCPQIMGQLRVREFKDAADVIGAEPIVIGGGYGTGRELVEFFLSKGPVDGYLGMLLTTVIWSVILAVTFELARTLRRYDYRSFLRELLGRG